MKETELMKKVYNISDLHVKILQELSKKENYDVVELSELFNKERTTIQKCLIKLMALQLVNRKQVNLSRAYKFVYFIINEDMIKNNLRDEIRRNIEELNIMIKNIWS